MRFNFFHTSFLPNKEYGGDRLYSEIVEQALHAEALGFDAVSLPEHHLINLLIVPAPLQLAAKIAALTKRIEIGISIIILPIHDVRQLAGEIVVSDIINDGRISFGVGRGAFDFELTRLGTPLSQTREKFEESLAILEALLTREEVAWDGKFDPITVLPRPVRPIPIAIASITPSSIYDCAKRGYDVQTTPLNSDFNVLLEQVNAFKNGMREAPKDRRAPRLSLQRVAYLCRDDTEVDRIVEQVYSYYMRFDNVFTGPGIVKAGLVQPLPRKQTLEEMKENLLVCTRSEMIDKLAKYAEAGIDEVILSAGFAFPQAEMLDMMERFAAEVMPHFSTEPETQARRGGSVAG